jgi:predicted dehydrogenase
MAATLNIGVIGMGWMGQAHSRSYINVPLRFPEAGIRPNLVICSDNVAARADSARDTLGFRQSTTRWQDVIEHLHAERPARRNRSGSGSRRQAHLL